MFKKKHSPESLSSIFGAFPKDMHDDVIVVMDHVEVGIHEPHMYDPDHLFLRGDSITVPYRVYFPEINPTSIKGFTSVQMAILAAIMTRHHSGYQRQVWAKLLSRYPADWTTPFMALLLGDYVCEILATLDDGLSPAWGALFETFSIENPEWSRPLTHRIITYWDIYYRRRIPSLVEYPGYRVTERLGLWDRKAAPKLMQASKSE